MICFRCVVENTALTPILQPHEWIVAQAQEIPIAKVSLPMKKLIFTSKHAVQFFVQRFEPNLGTPVVAVGTATAQLLKKHGFKNVRYQVNSEGLGAALQLVQESDDNEYQILTALNGSTRDTLARLKREIQVMPIYQVTPLFTPLDRFISLGLFDEKNQCVFDVRSGLLFEYTIDHLMRGFNVPNPNSLPKNIYLKCPKLSALQKCQALGLLNRLVI